MLSRGKNIASNAKRQVAVFGGAFDPPHLGHILATQYALAVFDIDEVWWVPCWQHYFNKDSTPFPIRLKMARAAIASFPKQRVRVSQIEKELGSDGRMLFTLRALKMQHADCQFRLLIGSDNFKLRRRWYRFQDIEKEFGVCVVPRGGVGGIIPLSSSKIRKQWLRSKTDKNLSYTLPLAVKPIIAHHQLYRRPRKTSRP